MHARTSKALRQSTTYHEGHSKHCCCCASYKAAYVSNLVKLLDGFCLDGLAGAGSQQLCALALWKLLSPSAAEPHFVGILIPRNFGPAALSTVLLFPPNSERKTPPGSLCASRPGSFKILFEVSDIEEKAGNRPRGYMLLWKDG